MMLLYQFFPLLLLLSVPALAFRPTIVPIGQGKINTTLGIINSPIAITAPLPVATPSISPSGTTSSALPIPTSNITLPACQSIQFAFPSGTGGNVTRAEAVKEAYQYAWNAYVEFAWGFDELQPLSKVGVNGILNFPLYCFFKLVFKKMVAVPRTKTTKNIAWIISWDSFHALRLLRNTQIKHN